MTKTSTKSKIIDVACKLFAKCGFDGTSCREISKVADVNLASINYHFKNKENLYCEVFSQSMQRMEENVTRLAQESDTIEELSWKLYLNFKEDSDNLRNSFIMFINESVNLGPAIMENSKKNNFGPPGFNVMLEVLTKQVGEEVPLAGREWAVRSIFNYLFHVSIITCSSFIQNLENEVPHFTPEAKKHSITCLVESVLNYLKEHPEKFEG